MSTNSYAVILNKQKTLDRIATLASIQLTLCKLCENEDESRNHLYLQCECVNSLWSKIQEKLQIQQIQINNVAIIIKFITAKFSSKCLKNDLIDAALSVMIWQKEPKIFPRKKKLNMSIRLKIIIQDCKIIMRKLKKL